MIDDQSQAAPPAPAAPPTARSGRIYRQRSRWPVAFGVIGTVLGAFNLLATLWAIAFAGMAQPQTMPPPAVWWSSIAVSGALAALSLTGSIGLFVRRRWAARTLWWWAIFSVIYLIGSAVLAVAFPDTFMPVMTQGSITTGGQGPPQAFVRTMVLFGVFIGLLWGLALPTLILIWMSRRVVREEIRSWRGGPSPERSRLAQSRGDRRV